TQLALSSALTALALPPAQCRVLLDGTLKAPGEYPHQETIIKGDETELSIMLAGILAKTERDREMTALSEQYPQYGFDMHKGYGTQSHYQSIRAAGLCALHRRTFVHPDQHLTD
ncbi:MAG: ribonuclease HII, partial [Candidatus Paceibacteria bacterium]